MEINNKEEILIKNNNISTQNLNVIAEKSQELENMSKEIKLLNSKYYSFTEKYNHI